MNNNNNFDLIANGITKNLVNLVCQIMPDDFIEYLMVKRPELFHQEHKYRTSPTHIIIRYRSASLLEKVLKINPNLKITDTNDQLNCFHYVCKYGSIDKIKLLLEYYDKSCDNNLLNLACLFNDETVIKFLVCKKIKLTHQSVYKACENQNLDTIIFLMEKYKEIYGNMDDLYSHKSIFLHLCDLKRFDIAIEIIKRGYYGEYPMRFLKYIKEIKCDKYNIYPSSFNDIYKIDRKKNKISPIFEIMLALMENNIDITKCDNCYPLQMIIEMDSPCISTMNLLLEKNVSMMKVIRDPNWTYNLPLGYDKNGSPYLSPFLCMLVCPKKNKSVNYEIFKNIVEFSNIDFNTFLDGYILPIENTRTETGVLALIYQLCIHHDSKILDLFLSMNLKYEYYRVVDFDTFIYENENGSPHHFRILYNDLIKKNYNCAGLFKNKIIINVACKCESKIHCSCYSNNIVEPSLQEPIIMFLLIFKIKKFMFGKFPRELPRNILHMILNYYIFDYNVTNYLNRI